VIGGEDDDEESCSEVEGGETGKEIGGEKELGVERGGEGREDDDEAVKVVPIS